MDTIQLNDQKISFSLLKKYLPLFVLVISIFVFAIISLNNSLYISFSTSQYLIFHNLAEFFSVAISMSIFGVGWYSYSQTKNKYVLFLSVSFFTIGIMDLMHTFSFVGMPDFITPNTLNKASQLWTVARFFSAIVLLASAFITKNSQSKLLTKPFLISCSIILILFDFVVVVLNTNKIPATFIEGQGLTSLKINGEYVIMALLIITLFFYWKKYTDSKEKFYLYFICGLIFSFFSEWAFTLFLNSFDTYNALGHVYKIFAFFFIYLDLFRIPLETPYLQLKEKETEYEQLSQQLNLFFENSDELLCIGNLDGNIVKINKVWRDVFGYTIEDFKDKTIFNIIHPEDLQKTNESLEELKSKKQIVTMENRVYSKDGVYKPVQWTCTVESGMVYCVAKVIVEKEEDTSRISNVDKVEEQDNLLKVMVERELKMVDLKKQIEELKKSHS